MQRARNTASPLILADSRRVDYDVIVVGGGPAGCAFVRSMAGDGVRRLLLVDRARFPRDKVCGDALTFQAIPAIHKVFPDLVGLTPSASATHRQILSYPTGHEFIREGSPLDVIPRLELDNALWQSAAAGGVDTLEGAHATELLWEGGRVSGVRLRRDREERVVRGRLVIGADGSRSVVRGATGSVAGDYVIHAVRQYVRGIPASTNGLVFLFDLDRRGYFWIFPFARNGEWWANVGYGNATDPRQLKETFRRYCESAEVRRHIGDARFEGRPVGFPLNLARFAGARLSRRLWGPGYLLLGDAASLIHPLSGEGISFAIESGRIAAEVLRDDRIGTEAKGPAYERRILRRVRPFFLSPSAFCAIRAPMLLPPRLRRPYLAIAAHAHRVVGWGEALPLAALVAALGLFWSLWLATGQAIGPPYTARATVFVALAATFCLAHARREHGWRFALTFPAVTLACSLAAEITGGLTGAVFGRYQYGPGMPAQILGLVPLVVPAAWYVVSYLSFAAALALSPAGARLFPRVARAVMGRAGLAAALFVGYDLVADPNHVYRAGWAYPSGGAYYGIPLQNFVAWFLLGLGSFAVLEVLRRRTVGPPPERPAADGAALGLFAYAGLVLHESVFAFAIADHPGAGSVGLTLTALVLLGGWWSRTSSIRAAMRSSLSRLGTAFGSLRFRDILVLQGAPVMGLLFGWQSGQAVSALRLGLFLLASWLLVAHVFCMNDWGGAGADASDPNKAKWPTTVREATLPSMALLAGAFGGLSLVLFGQLAWSLGVMSGLIVAQSLIYSHPRLGGKGTPILSSVLHTSGGLLHFLLGYCFWRPADLPGVLLGLYFGLVFTAGHLTQEAGDHDADRRNAILTNAVRFGQVRTFKAGFAVSSLSYALLLGLTVSGTLPGTLLVTLVGYPLQAAFFRRTLRAGLTFDGVSRYRAAYRVLYAAIGIVIAAVLLSSAIRR